MHDQRRPIEELIALRRQILDSGDGWANFGEQQINRMMAERTTVESEIVAAAWISADDRLQALSILLDSDDDPGFADDFKNRLFLKLRKLSSENHQ